MMTKKYRRRSSRETSDEYKDRSVSHPCISYAHCIRSRFYWKDQEYTVKSCPLAILRAFLKQHAQGLSPTLRAAVLECLQEEAACDALGRWASIEMLMDAGTALPFIDD